MKIKLSKILIFISFIIVFINYESIAQQTGIFMAPIKFDGKMTPVAYYVPEDYNPEKSYPLVIGMSAGGGPGAGIRGMLLPMASSNGIILACPDYINGKGCIITETILNTLSKYSIDEKNIVLTGYSAGGAATFPWAIDNPEYARGAIGVAIATGGVDFSNCNNRAFGIICGTFDSMWGSNKTISEGINQNGGSCLFISKDSVYHMDVYFGSKAFQDDWMKCYNHIQNFIPRPQVKLLSPPKGTVMIEIPVRLVWKKEMEAICYNLRLLDYGGKVLVDTNILDTTFILSELGNNETRFWRVRAICKNDSSEWSYKWNFTSEAIAPNSKVNLLSPADNAKNIQIYSSLSWQPVSESDFYHIQISCDNFQTFFHQDSAVLHDGTSEVTCSNKPVFNYGTSYKWRVRGGNLGGYGPWSDIFTFTTYQNTNVGESNINDSSKIESLVLNCPANDLLRLSYRMKKPCLVNFSVFNLSGNIIYECCENNAEAGIYHIEIDISKFTPAVYFLWIIAEQHFELKKFIIQR